MGESELNFPIVLIPPFVTFFQIYKIKEPYTWEEHLICSHPKKIHVINS